jgi:hypothetical protein
MVLSSSGVLLLLDLVLQYARHIVDQHEDGSPCERRGFPIQNDWLGMICTCTGLNDQSSHDGLSRHWECSLSKYITRLIGILGYDGVSA